jgi:hypothetical protein
MALDKDRVTNKRKRLVLQLAVAANVLCYAGALAAVNSSGNVKPGATALGLRGVGVFRDRVDNVGGGAGDQVAEVELDVAQFANSADEDEITAADIGKVCYMVDDLTVAKTDGAGTRSVAGYVADVDGEGVWIDFLYGGVNAGSGKVYLPMPTVSLKAADNGVTRMRAPVAGTITGISGVCGTAVTGANATAQGKIAGNNITDGLLTWPLAGAAIGQGQAAHPSADNVVAVGDIISFVVAGGGTQTGNADIVVEITL